MPLILLAEDESSTIDHVRSALASQGWLVKTVGSRDQALRAASEFAPQLVLVNAGLAGAEDLVRTFSRRSGGPGVVLLTMENGDGTKASAASADVDAILAKPLDTGDLIETIRQGLVDGKGKPTPPPVAETNQVFSSQEIFGDLLDDILDPETEAQEAESAQSKPQAAAKKEAPQAEQRPPAPEPKKVDQPETVVEALPEPEPVAEPEAEPTPAQGVDPVVDVAAASKIDAVPVTGSDGEFELVEELDPTPSGEASVTGLEDLEEVVREGVEAWADSVGPDDLDDESDRLAKLAESAQEESPPEPEEDLESKLEDTLAGVLAASLSQVESVDKTTPAPPTEESDSVDALLSQALGDLNLGAVSAAQLSEGVENKIDLELEALAASVEVESIAEVEEPDLPVGLEELAGFSPERESEITEVAETVSEAEEPAEVAESIAEAEEPAVQIDKDEAMAIEDLAEPAEEIATPTVPATKGLEFGEYTLEQQIGVGGMASVWKARRKGVEGFEKRVAIKKILPQAAENDDFVEMFIDEAKLAAQLNHSNITHIYDLGKIDDDYFIAMEYVEGKNLRQILDKSRKKQQAVPVGVALFVASQIADALDYAHRSKDFDDAELGLVHRDVSPQNVLLSYEGDIKLCDFGIAKAVSKISTTQMGALKGKLQYMSPEQAWGKSIDHRSDLFSLGTLLYEMLTGERLFSGESEMAVLERVREADVGTQIIQSQEIPAGIKGVLLRALAQEPDDRFQSAEEFQRGLDELLKEESPAPGPKSLSTFVRAILDLQAEAPREEEHQEPQQPFEVADDLEWDPEATSGEEDDDDETTPWLRRVLTRLLPVILVVAVGGGIIVGLMQKESPLTEPPAESIPQTLVAPEAESPATGEEAAVAPQGQPPPTTSESASTPDPPAKTPPKKPEPEPAAAKAQPAAAKPSPAPQKPVVKTEDPPTDPELERQVEEDLQRVQELMASPSTPENQAQPTTPDQDADPEPFSLESLWTDVTSAADTGQTVEPGPGVIEPKLLNFEAPEYTEAARQAGAEGTVRVSVLVDENGRALEVRLIQALEAQVGLEEALMDAARRAAYQPASKNGVPVKMWYQVAVLFEP